MSEKSTRRSFLTRSVILAGSAPFVSSSLAAAATPDTTPSSEAFLTAGERAFVERMVNTICPADHLTADGVTSGLAAFLERRLAARSSEPATAGQAQLFRAGVAAANQACRDRYGVSFARLAESDARAFLADLRAGSVDASVPLAAWSSEIVDPLLIEACYSGPVYGTYGSRMFVKLFGHAGSTASI